MFPALLNTFVRMTRTSTWQSRGTITVPMVEVMQMRAWEDLITFLGWQQRVCSELRVNIRAFLRQWKKRLCPILTDLTLLHPSLSALCAAGLSGTVHGHPARSSVLDSPSFRPRPFELKSHLLYPMSLCLLHLLALSSLSGIFWLAWDLLFC